MAEGRRLKQHLNKTWYKSSRGGKDVTSTKDLPWTSQEKEREGRKSYWKTARDLNLDKTEYDGNSKMTKDTDDTEESSIFKMVKNTETVVFILATPGSVLQKKL